MLPEAFHMLSAIGFAAIVDPTSAAAPSVVKSVAKRPVTARCSADAARPDDAHAYKPTALRLRRGGCGRGANSRALRRPGRCRAPRRHQQSATRVRPWANRTAATGRRRRPAVHRARLRSACKRREVQPTLHLTQDVSTANSYAAPAESRLCIQPPSTSQTLRVVMVLKCYSTTQAWMTWRVRMMVSARQGLPYRREPCRSTIRLFWNLRNEYGVPSDGSVWRQGRHSDRRGLPRLFFSSECDQAC